MSTLESQELIQFPNLKALTAASRAFELASIDAYDAILRANQRQDSDKKNQPDRTLQEALLIAKCEIFIKYCNLSHAYNASCTQRGLKEIQKGYTELNQELEFSIARAKGMQDLST